MTAGASAPERLVACVCDWLRERGATEIEEITVARETTTFAQPPELRHPVPARTPNPAATAA